MSEIFTHNCGAKWTGLKRSHCSACHVTFGGVASFDRHRQVGSRMGRKCLTPESLGLVDNGQNIWVGVYE
jgi:hypothetical protein